MFSKRGNSVRHYKGGVGGTVPYPQASSSVGQWWLWGHQNSAWGRHAERGLATRCASEYRKPEKQKRGGFTPLPTAPQHGLCCSPAPSHSDRGWGQGPTPLLGVKSFLSRRSDGLKPKTVNTLWCSCSDKVDVLSPMLIKLVWKSFSHCRVVIIFQWKFPITKPYTDKSQNIKRNLLLSKWYLHRKCHNQAYKVSTQNVTSRWWKVTFQ